MQGFLKIIKKISLCSYNVSSLVLFIIMLIMVADIILRAFGHPIMGSLEIVEYMMIFVVVLSFAHTQVKKKHIGVDIVTNLLPVKIRLLVDVVTLSMSVGITIIAVYATYLQAFEILNNKITTAVLSIPVFPAYFVVFLGMLIFCLALISDLIITTISLFRGSITANEVADSPDLSQFVSE